LIWNIAYAHNTLKHLVTRNAAAGKLYKLNTVGGFFCQRHQTAAPNLQTYVLNHTVVITLLAQKQLLAIRPLFDVYPKMTKELIPLPFLSMVQSPFLVVEFSPLSKVCLALIST
jgi:hypothetical protein